MKHTCGVKTIPQKPLTPAFELLFAPNEVSGSALNVVGGVVEELEEHHLNFVISTFIHLFNLCLHDTFFST